MNKPVIVVLTLVCFFIKNSTAQIRPGIRAGLNFSNVHRTDGNWKMNADLQTGFHAGMNLDVPMCNNIYFQPGLLFNTKGFKNGWVIKMDAKAYYLEMPLNILYKRSLGSGKLLLGAGPYLGYGLGGKWKTPEANNGGPWVDIRLAMDGNLEFTNDAKGDNYNSVIFGSDYTYGKPIDYGANFEIGYEFSNKFLIQFNGQLGIANIAPRVDGNKTNDVIRNMGFGFSMGYTF